MVGLPRATRGERDYLNALLYGIHSPPIVVRDKVIHGSHVADRRITKEAIPGWVRAWDVRTGEHAWGLPHRAEQRRRVRRGHLAEPVVALLGQRQRLVDARGRQRARARLPADRHDDQRLLRRRPARRQPVLGDPDRRRRGDRRARMALPGSPPRAVGLRLPHASEPGGRGGRRPPDQGDRAGEQAGLRLRVRPRHGRSDLADRGAPGADRDEHAGRGAVADAAVPDEAGAVRLPGRDPRRPGRLHAGGPPVGGRGGRGLPARTAVHAARPPDRGGDAGHADAPAGRRHGRLGGRGGRFPRPACSTSRHATRPP